MSVPYLAVYKHFLHLVWNLRSIAENQKAIAAVVHWKKGGRTEGFVHVLGAFQARMCNYSSTPLMMAIVHAAME